MENAGMRTILIIACFVALLVNAAPQLIVAPPNGHVKISWDYDPNELSTNLFFILYETTNITTPLTNWTVLTNMVGTNTYGQFDVVPGEHYFVAQASNFWGETSITSAPGHTPPLPYPINNSLKIEKAP